MRTQSKYTCNRPQAQENASDQFAIGFSFASDWLRRWRDFPRPITERSKAKSKAIPDCFQHSIENYSLKSKFETIVKRVSKDRS